MEIGPGTRLANYRLVSELGRGGMGVVYLAEHVQLDRKAAIKVLRGQGEDAVQRFFNEAQAVNKIGHQHIVDISDFGITPAGQSYLVMEHLTGATLSAKLKTSAPWPLARAVAVAGQVADALGAAHARGIVHRDLKPDNIFLVERGTSRDFVKLLDFGVAKLLAGSDLEAARTRSGSVVGTPFYMSPEQCLARPDVDQRADIYALGVVLYEMLTGAPPYRAQNWVHILQMHASHPFPRVRDRRPELPEGVELVLARAVAKEPADRYPDMAAVGAALASLEAGALAGRDSSATRIGRPGGSEAPAELDLALAETAAPPPAAALGATTTAPPPASGASTTAPPLGSGVSATLTAPPLAPVSPPAQLHTAERARPAGRGLLLGGAAVVLAGGLLLWLVMPEAAPRDVPAPGQGPTPAARPAAPTAVPARTPVPLRAARIPKAPVPVPVAPPPSPAPAATAPAPPPAPAPAPAAPAAPEESPRAAVPDAAVTPPPRPSRSSSTRPARTPAPREPTTPRPFNRDDVKDPD